VILTLKVVDQRLGTSAPVRRAGVSLRLASERVTAREIIRSRVTAEVEEFSRPRRTQGPTRSFIVDVESNSPEAKLNSLDSARSNARKLFDLEHEIDRAVTGFTQRRFIMLLDDRQIDDLDAPVGLRPESEVVFIYLKPLKGG
jgi:hypothetical protein